MSAWSSKDKNALKFLFKNINLCFYSFSPPVGIGGTVGGAGKGRKNRARDRAGLVNPPFPATTLPPLPARAKEEVTSQKPQTSTADTVDEAKDVEFI